MILFAKKKYRKKSIFLEILLLPENLIEDFFMTIS